MVGFIFIVDFRRQKGYNRHMNMDNYEYNYACDKCENEEHGNVSDRGTCLCCGFIINQELYNKKDNYA